MTEKEILLKEKELDIKLKISIIKYLTSLNQPGQMRDITTDFNQDGIMKTSTFQDIYNIVTSHFQK